MPYNVKHEFKGITEQGMLKWHNPYAKDLSLRFYLESVEVFSKTLPGLLKNHDSAMPSDIAQAISEAQVTPNWINFDNDNTQTDHRHSCPSGMRRAP